MFHPQAAKHLVRIYLDPSKNAENTSSGGVYGRLGHVVYLDVPLEVRING